MQQSLFEKLEIGMTVSHNKCGTKLHDFFFVISKINKENQTVDIERYSRLTGKPDVEKKIYKTDVSLADIEFIEAKNNFLNFDATKCFPT